MDRSSARMLHLIRLDRWQALTEAEHRGFAPLGPDLVAELGQPQRRWSRGRVCVAIEDGRLSGQRRPAGLAAAAP